MKAFDAVFSAITLGSLSLKNRLVMSPMSGHMSPVTGHCTQREIDFYEVRASGGVGLVIVGAAYVRQEGGFGYGQLGIHNDEMVPGLARLARAIKSGGAKAGIQLHHAGRQTASGATGLPCVAPSAIPWPPDAELPLELTLDDIEKLIECFGQGARRAMEAGFDAVEIHSAHGYLPAQFLSKQANRRKDEYGGGFENRTRFMRRVYAEVRDAVGPRTPITVRVSGSEFIPLGITIEETLEYVRMLEKLGVDGISVSSGCSPYYRTVPNMSFPLGLNAFMSARVKEAVGVPVIVAGRINSPQLAEDIIRQGKADMICLGRELIADPEFPLKARTGRVSEIRPCIACNKGCHDRSLEDRATKCVMNPAAGRERSYSVPKSPKAKKVAVIGGGPAGMAAATVAAEAGHRVTIFERGETLGGRLILAAVPPNKDGYKTALEYLKDRVRAMGIKVELGVEWSLSSAAGDLPDAVILATGASPFVPGFKGLDEVSFCTADDVLSGKVVPNHDVLVVGGGAVGAETAHYLGDKGYKVSLVEMTDKIGSDMAADARSQLIDNLSELPTVNVYTGTKVLEFQKGAAICSCDGKTLEISAETVIVAVGAISNTRMLEEIRAAIPQVHVVGDAAKPADLLFATRSGADAGRSI